MLRLQLQLLEILCLLMEKSWLKNMLNFLNEIFVYMLKVIWGGISPIDIQDMIKREITPIALLRSL